MGITVKGPSNGIFPAPRAPIDMRYVRMALPKDTRPLPPITKAAMSARPAPTPPRRAGEPLNLVPPEKPFFGAVWGRLGTRPTPLPVYIDFWRNRLMEAGILPPPAAPTTVAAAARRTPVAPTASRGPLTAPALPEGAVPHPLLGW